MGTQLAQEGLVQLAVQAKALELLLAVVRLWGKKEVLKSNLTWEFLKKKDLKNRVIAGAKSDRGTRVFNKLRQIEDTKKWMTQLAS